MLQHPQTSVLPLHSQQQSQQHQENENHACLPLNSQFSPQPQMRSSVEPQFLPLLRDEHHDYPNDSCVAYSRLSAQPKSRRLLSWLRLHMPTLPTAFSAGWPDLARLLLAMSLFLVAAFIMCVSNSYTDRVNVNSHMKAAKKLQAAQQQQQQQQQQQIQELQDLQLASGPHNAGTYVDVPDMFLDAARAHVAPSPELENFSDVLVKISYFSILLRAVFVRRSCLLLLRRFFVVYASLFLLRALTLVITVIPTPQRTCNKEYAENIFYDAFLLMTRRRVACGDVFFSGHTIAYTLAACVWVEYSRRTRDAAPAILLAAVGPIMLLLSSMHYSVDIMYGALLTLFGFKLHLWCVRGQIAHTSRFARWLRWLDGADLLKISLDRAWRQRTMGRLYQFMAPLPESARVCASCARTLSAHTPLEHSPACSQCDSVVILGAGARFAHADGAGVAQTSCSNAAVGAAAAANAAANANAMTASAIASASASASATPTLTAAAAAGAAVMPDIMANTKNSSTKVNTARTTATADALRRRGVDCAEDESSLNDSSHSEHGSTDYLEPEPLPPLSSCWDMGFSSHSSHGMTESTPSSHASRSYSDTIPILSKLTPPPAQNSQLQQKVHMPGGQSVPGSQPSDWEHDYNEP